MGGCLLVAALGMQPALGQEQPEEAVYCIREYWSPCDFSLAPIVPTLQSSAIPPAG